MKTDEEANIADNSKVDVETDGNRTQKTQEVQENVKYARVKARFCKD